MAWRALIGTDVGLAKIIGVSPPAVRKAAARGLIAREADGRWDVLSVVDRWRQNTSPTLQRPARGREFRPWLDGFIPLESSVWQELVRRVNEGGAEWQRS